MKISSILEPDADRGGGPTSDEHKGVEYDFSAIFDRALLVLTLLIFFLGH